MTRKYVKFGAGWNKQVQKDGTEFISVSTKSKGQEVFVDKNSKTGSQTQTRLFLQIGDNDPVVLDGFSVFPSGADTEKYPTAPQYTITASFED